MQARSHAELPKLPVARCVRVVADEENGVVSPCCGRGVWEWSGMNGGEGRWEGQVYMYTSIHPTRGNPADTAPTIPRSGGEGRDLLGPADEGPAPLGPRLPEAQLEPAVGAKGVHFLFYPMWCVCSFYFVVEWKGLKWFGWGKVQDRW